MSGLINKFNKEVYRGIRSKKRKKYAVVYTYEDQEGVKRQKWESFITKKDALRRKAEVETELNSGSFIPPNTITIRMFLKDFADLYGTKQWGLSAYSGNVSLIENYSNPLVGDCYVQNINRRAVDGFIQKLQKTPPVDTAYRHPKTEYITACTIEKVIKLMHCAFRQAVRWDMISQNPFDDVILPKREKKQEQFGRRMSLELRLTTVRTESYTWQSILLLPAHSGLVRSLV